jgi:hypothetical protein
MKEVEAAVTQNDEGHYCVKRKCSRNGLLFFYVGITAAIFLMSSPSGALFVALFLAVPIAVMYRRLPAHCEKQTLIIDRHGLRMQSASVRWDEVHDGVIRDIPWLKTITLSNAFIIVPRPCYVDGDGEAYIEAMIRYGGRNHPLVRRLVSSVSQNPPERTTTTGEQTAAGNRDER